MKSPITKRAQEALRDVEAPRISSALTSRIQAGCGALRCKTLGTPPIDIYASFFWDRGLSIFACLGPGFGTVRHIFASF